MAPPPPLVSEGISLGPTGEAAQACCVGTSSAVIGPTYALGDASPQAAGPCAWMGEVIQPRVANMSVSVLGFAPPPGPSDGVGRSR